LMVGVPPNCAFPPLEEVSPPVDALPPADVPPTTAAPPVAAPPVVAPLVPLESEP